jgi:hypothetical protein
VVTPPRLALVVCLSLAVLHTWPIGGAPARRSLNQNADAQQWAWTLSWIAHILPRNPLHAARAAGAARFGYLYLAAIALAAAFGVAWLERRLKSPRSRHILAAAAHGRDDRGVVRPGSDAAVHPGAADLRATPFFRRDWAIDAIRKENATHVMVHLERFSAAEREDIRQALVTRTDLKLVASDALGHRLYRVEGR